MVGAAYTDKGDKTEWFTPKLRDLQGGLDKTLGAGNARKRIEAILTLPRGTEPKKLPLIVMPHGGPYARDSEQYDWWVQYLGAQGYAVVQPNCRGSTGYGTAFQGLGEGQWGTGMQDDLLDAVKWLAGEGIADPRRVSSSAPPMAAMPRCAGPNATARPIAARCRSRGVSDLSGMMRYDRKFLQNAKFSNSYWKKQAPDFTAVSPQVRATEFSIPILLVHGDKDKRVPVSQSNAMAEQLKLAGKPYQFIEQLLADRHFSREADRLEFLKAMKAFLDRYNPS